MLTHLFQQSLTLGDIPSQWKMAYVTLIYKSGKKSDPQNYRPVSLTSIICKVMEHILVSHIMQHLEEHDIATSAFEVPNLVSGQNILVSHSCSLLLMTLQRP